jgi:alkylation response protein AidB-like acyl-CoA dehydrogenase
VAEINPAEINPAEINPEFTFTDEQRQLRAAVKKFCAENIDEQTVRRLMESDPPFDVNVWTRLGTELGVLGLSVPDADGGAGGSLVDQAVAVEELGAALACGPVFGTVFLAIPALVAASSGPVRDGLLPELVEGRRTAAFAVADRAGAFDPSAVSVTASRSGEECTQECTEEWTLTGTVERVVDGGAADDLLVAADGPDGVALYAVDAAADGVHRTSLMTLDLTRPQATIRLADASARVVADPAEAQRVIEHALHVGSALLAVEQVGAAQHLLDLSVEYAAYHAVWALTDGSDDPALAASIAQATASAAFTRVATDTIQVHGGIGFTWEHQAHLYFKRATTDAALLGTPEQHRSRLAELVLDTASADRAPRVADGTPA